VYALDASQSTLDDLRRAADDRGITTLRTVRVPRHRLEIPEPVDLLFVSATYHHLRNQAAYFANALQHLRPRARVVILESRHVGLLASLRGRHGSSPARLQREMTEAGYRLTETSDIVRGHFFGLFEIDPGVEHRQPAPDTMDDDSPSQTAASAGSPGRGKLER
jgi:SAM-dependent methyltransferase